MIWIAKLLVARNPALTLAHAKRLAWAGLAGVVLLVVVGIAAWSYFSGRSDGTAGERAKQAEIETEAVTQAREADSVARGTVDAENASVAAENAGARQAGDASDDPLKASMDSLRNER